MLYQLSYARAPQSGGGRIRTFVALSAADLQSAPFGRSGTPPRPPPPHPPYETSADNRPLVSLRGVCCFLLRFGSELTKGLEPLTCLLQISCLTIELRQLVKAESDRLVS